VGPAAHFADPWSFAKDGGKLYLLDGETVRAVDLASAEVTTLAGAFGMAGGDDGTGTAARFFQPSGIVATGGALYLTDTENHTLRKIDLGSGAVTTVAGAYEQGGTTDAIGTDARFQEPEGLAFDGAGHLFIADTDNDTIRKMDLASGAVSTIAGTAGMPGSTDGARGIGLLDKPKAIAWDGSGLWIIDSGTQSIRHADPDGTIGTLATFDTVPAGIAFDAGAVLVALGDQRIVRIDPMTQAVTTLAGGLKQSGFLDGAAGDARFSRPAGLLADGAGKLYVADGGNYALRVIDLASGAVTTFAGAASIGSEDGIGGTARFWAPAGFAVSTAGIAYVTDGNNHTIRRVALDSQTVTTLAGAAGKMGNADGSSGDARFYQPSGIALDDAAQILYIADGGNHAVRKMDLSSGTVSTLAPSAMSGADLTRLSSPDGLFLDGNRLFVSDHDLHVIAAIDLSASAMTLALFAGKPNEGGTTDGSGSAARFYGPSGIAGDGSGNLYVADVLNDAVRAIAIDGAKVTTVAASGLSFPSSLAVDGAGDLFVADSLDNRVQWIHLGQGNVTTVIGTDALSGVRLGSLPSQISQPAALALTPDGKLLLSSENALLVAR
jgi:DNA-binding beta-propeller fold protein YncE